MTSMHSKWRNWRNGMRARRLQMGCNIIEWNVETRQIRNLGDTSQTHVHGSKKIRQQTRRWNCAEQEVEAKNYWYWIHQLTGHHRHNRGQPPTLQTDECVLPSLGLCGPSHREDVQTIEKHTTNCKIYIPIAGRDFNAELGPGHGTECTSVGWYTQHWLMSQDYTTLNTMYRKTPQKQNDLHVSKR